MSRCSICSFACLCRQTGVKQLYVTEELRQHWRVSFPCACRSIVYLSRVLECTKNTHYIHHLMSRHSGVFIVAVIGFLLTGCASGRLIEAVPSDSSISTDEGVHRIFLVGDGGEETHFLKQNMDLLRERIQSSEIPATVVYLGEISILPECRTAKTQLPTIQLPVPYMHKYAQ